MTSAVSASSTTLSWVRRLALPLPLVLLAWVGLSTVAWANVLDDIGYTQLVNILGGPTPVGAGVAISQVEVSDTSGAYFPDATDAQFTAGSDPFGQAMIFNDGSGGASLGTTPHSTFSVGRNFYGNTSSLASGANEVTIYEADDWVENVLNRANGEDPLSQNFRVQNFSWIGTFGSDSSDRDVLRRFDYVIDTDDVTALVGINNNGDINDPLIPPNPSLAHPHLLSHSYNAIAVGRTDAYHSRGVTASFYGPGRYKPDIVVPVTSTSAATAKASGTAAMLHGVVADTDAAKSETMKAILMAGATKEEFANFVEPSTGTPNPWSRTPTQPLDDIFGAGELNVYNSYLMTLGGQTAGSTDNTGALVNTVDSYGWDYQTVSPGGDMFYNFVIPAGSTAAELSIILAWNVEVTDTDDSSQFSGSESLANLDLTLYDSSSTFTISGPSIDESTSTVDNVEHIYQTGLGPGTYTLKVSTDSTRDFGLAWRMSTLFDTPSADFNEDGDVGGADFLAWQRGYRTLLGATHADGDADGDGDVDSDDLQLLNSGFGTIVQPLSGIVAVPEPSTAGIALLAAAFLPLLFRMGRRSSALCQ